MMTQFAQIGIQDMFESPGTRLRTGALTGAIPPVMANPPTVTTNTNSTISSGYNSAWNDTTQHWFGGGTMTQVVPNAFGRFVNTITQPGGTLANGTAYGNNGIVQFYTDAPQFEIITLGTNGRYQVLVNGQKVSAPVNTLPNDSVIRYQLYDFTSISTVPTPRTITILCDEAYTFYGIRVPTLYDIWAAPPANQTRMVVGGDSYTQGAGPSNDACFHGFASIMANLLGITDVWQSGSGGTGWVQTNGSSCNYQTRFANDIIGPAPGVAVSGMGINDNTGYSQGTITTAQITAAVEFCVGEFRSSLLNSVHIVLGPWSPHGNTPTAIRDAIKAGTLIDTSGLTIFIDTMTAGYEWQSTLQGCVGATQGLGNGDWALGTDNTHPSTAGYAMLGARAAAAIINASKALA